MRSIVVAVPAGARAASWAATTLGGGRAAAATRASRSSNALEAVETELVAIHDAARPLVTPELIEGVVATLVADPEAAGAIAATPVTDTIKQVEGRDEAPSRLQSLGTHECRAFAHAIGRSGCARQVERRWIEGAALGGADASGLPGRWHLRERSARATLSAATAATDEAMLVEAAGGQGADPSLAAGEPQGDDAAAT